MIQRRFRAPILALAGGIALCGISATAAAQEAEDQSEAFQSDVDRIAAERGVAEAESTVTTHENGMTSAVVGLSALKMLVVRQNEDGTLSYGHAENKAEADEFIASDDDGKPAEE